MTYIDSATSDLLLGIFLIFLIFLIVILVNNMLANFFKKVLHVDDAPKFRKNDRF